MPENNFQSRKPGTQQRELLPILTVFPFNSRRPQRDRETAAKTKVAQSLKLTRKPQPEFGLRHKSPPYRQPPGPSGAMIRRTCPVLSITPQRSPARGCRPAGPNQGRALRTVECLRYVTAPDHRHRDLRQPQAVADHINQRHGPFRRFFRIRARAVSRQSAKNKTPFLISAAKTTGICRLFTTFTPL